MALGNSLLSLKDKTKSQKTVVVQRGDGEVFAIAKVKLQCSEVCADAQVKLSLPALPIGKTSLSKITSLTE